MEQQDRERQERERQERERQERERLERERQAAAGQETPALVNITPLDSFVLFQRYTQINVQHMIALKGKLEFILRTKNNRGF